MAAVVAEVNVGVSSLYALKAPYPSRGCDTLHTVKASLVFGETTEHHTEDIVILR